MHRDGAGNKIEDLEAAKADWVVQGRTKRTYPTKGEYDAYQEVLGPVVAQSDSHELLGPCDIKVRARGGTPFICHNCLLLRPKGGGQQVFYSLAELEQVKLTYHLA